MTATFKILGLSCSLYCKSCVLENPSVWTTDSRFLYLKLKSSSSAEARGINDSGWNIEIYGMAFSCSNPEYSNFNISYCQNRTLQARCDSTGL